MLTVFIFSTVFLIICWYIKWYSALLRHIYTYWDIKAYSALFSHIQHPVQSSHIHNLAIFWALKYLEPEANLKPLKTLIRHIQNPAIGHYSATFRHIQNLVQHLYMQKPGILRILEYSEPFHNCIPTHIQGPVILTKIYKYPELKHTENLTHIQNPLKEFFAFKKTIIFPMPSILDLSLGSEYAYLSLSTH